MNPVMAVGNTKDIHVQGVLSLCSPGDLALGWEHALDKLWSISLPPARTKKRPYSSHLLLDIVINATMGEQLEVLAKAAPVFIMRLKRFLSLDILNIQSKKFM